MELLAIIAQGLLQHNVYRKLGWIKESVFRNARQSRFRSLGVQLSSSQMGRVVSVFITERSGAERRTLVAVVLVSFVEFLHQLSPSPFDGFQTSLELSGFLVDVGQLLLELLLSQSILSALVPDEGFDFVPQ
jgi:hypothetical protein